MILGDVQLPPDKAIPFTVNLTWNYDDNRQFNGPDGYLPMNNGVNMPPAPEGYEVKYPDGFIVPVTGRRVRMAIQELGHDLIRSTRSRNRR